MGLRQKANDLLDSAGDTVAKLSTFQSRITLAFTLAIVALFVAVMGLVK